LERDGLVQRVRNPQARRQLNIFLTDKGRSLRDVLIPCALAVNSAVLQSLDDSEQRQLSSLLRRIITSLEPAALDDNAV
jgi:DNA-binding MarR family transcriptional regulator